MSGDDVVQNAGYANPSGETSSKVQLPEHTFMYLLVNLNLWVVASLLETRKSAIAIPSLCQHGSLQCHRDVF